MAYNELNQYTSPNQSSGAENRRQIKGITIHWWGNPSNNPTFEGVVAWLCNPASQVSAHLVVTGTGRRVAQIVDDNQIAWHAGNWEGNRTTIGIECDPRVRDEDYDVIAEVVADLWRYYGKLPLYPHKHWVSTACPGVYDVNRIKALAERKLSGEAPQSTVNYDSKINDAYKRILLRPADEGGLNHYRSQIAKGWSMAQVEADLMNSNERKLVEARLAREKAEKEAREAVTSDIEKKAEAEAKQKREAEQAIKSVQMEEALKRYNETERLARENNGLLKQILGLLQKLVDKITGVFK